MKSDVWDLLGQPRYVLAPMVDASELPWRLLSRKYGAQLCFTPMIHSGVFIKDSKYRNDCLTTCPEDRPLIFQFCGHDPKILLEAAIIAQHYCDAIDINLGCPQAIAKRGFYGAFLEDEWQLLEMIVSKLRSRLSVPVSCKIRIFNDLNKSIDYAKMLEKSGCQILTVHGRTKEQKGSMTGIADWSFIKAIKEAVNIPVIANGNIQYFSDIEKCLSATKADAVMSAEGNLCNPAIFMDCLLPVWEPAIEYFNLVQKYNCQLCCSRGHLFKLFHSLLALKENNDQREKLANGKSIEEFMEVCSNLKSAYIDYHTGKRAWPKENGSFDLKLPPWICQPYVRPSCADPHVKINEKNDQEFFDECGSKISKRQFKRLQKMKKMPIILECEKMRRRSETCKFCPNLLGFKCANDLCKTCCKAKCRLENISCVGHHILRRSTPK